MIPFVRKYAAALAVLALSACQARAAGPQDPAAGSLTGRIASDDGTPLAGVVVEETVVVNGVARKVRKVQLELDATTMTNLQAGKAYIAAVTRK